MATLPVTGYVAGGALCAPLVARHQRAWGRRRAFQLGLLVAMATHGAVRLRGLVAQLLAARRRDDGAPATTTPMPALYRFAATELVAPAFKERAISWVLAGGILGAVVGPNLASATRDALPVRLRRRLRRAGRASRCCRC